MAEKRGSDATLRQMRLYMVLRICLALVVKADHIWKLYNKRDNMCDHAPEIRKCMGITLEPRNGAARDENDARADFDRCFASGTRLPA